MYEVYLPQPAKIVWFRSEIPSDFCPATTMSFASLPPELLLIISRYIPASQESRISELFKTPFLVYNEHCQLASLAATNSSLQKLIRPLLFQTVHARISIVFRNHSGDFLEYVDWRLKEVPHICGFIRSVAI